MVYDDNLLILYLVKFFFVFFVFFLFHLCIFLWIPHVLTTYRRFPMGWSSTNRYREDSAAPIHPCPQYWTLEKPSPPPIPQAHPLYHLIVICVLVVLSSSTIYSNLLTYMLEINSSLSPSNVPSNMEQVWTKIGPAIKSEYKCVVKN